MDTRPGMSLLSVQTRLGTLLTVFAAGLSLFGCGGGSDCGGPFCIGPEQPRATTIKLADGNGQTGAPGRELPQPIEVVVTDDDDTPIQDVIVTFSVGQGAGSLSDTEIRSDVNGRARVHWTLGMDPGSQSAQAMATGTSGSQLKNSPLTFSAEAVRPPPAKLVIRQAPSVAARNGIPLDQQPIVEVLDADDQPVPQIQVTAAIASGGGTLSGTTAVMSDGSGRVSYTDLALVGSSGSRTLRFSVVDPALEVVSGAIILGAGVPTQLAGIPPLTYQGTVGSPVSPAPSVVVKDASGNGVPGISVTFIPNRDASVSPEAVLTDESGIAQVTSWTLGSSATGEYTLTALVEGSALTPVRFSATARAGAAGRLTIVTQPSSPTPNGSAFTQQPVIQVVDRDGNPAPQGNVLITATVSSGPNGELQNASATTTASGQATFSGLTLTGSVGNYTISFSAEGLTGVTSNPITLTVGPPAQLALAVPPPATARSRVPLAPQPVVQVQDASGNPVPQAGIAVVASVVAGGTPGGQATVTTGVDGRATFTDLTIIGTPGQKTLSFSSTSPTLPAVSAQITLPDVARIELRPDAPTTAVVGTTLTNVFWVLKDVADQPVSDAPFSLSVSAGSLGSSSGVSGEGGTVPVTWTLGTTSGDQDIEVSVSETVASSQARIQVTADAPDTLRLISGDNQSAAPNSQLPEPFVVRVLDKYGNGVFGAIVQWRSCDGTGDYNPTTDDQGFSSASQMTGPQSGSACTRAFSPDVSGPQITGSPVTFNYTITGGAPMSQSQAGKRGVLAPPALPPGPPRSRGVVRPSSR
jgi:adhesin/invasin